MEWSAWFLGLALAASGSVGEAPDVVLAWGDADGDGLVDLYAAGARGGDRLLRNDGSGGFEDATARSGLAGRASARAATWADFDRDGQLDLLRVSAAGELELWRGRGALDFEELGRELALLAPRPVRSADWVDYDADGWPDVRARGDDGGAWLHRGLGGALFETVELDLAGPRAGGVEILASAPPSDPAEPGARAATGERDLPGTARAASGAAGVSGASRAGSGQAAGAQGLCVDALFDQGQPGACLDASSVPTLGALFPLGPSFNVTSLGRVGMGTTAPSHPLHVIGSARASQDVLAGFGTTAAPAFRFGSGTEQSGVASPSFETVSLLTSGAERVRVSSSGNVGLGTSAPLVRLDVAGRGRFDATATAPALADAAVIAEGSVGSATGYLGVEGSNDFDGFPSADWNGLEIAVAGIAPGGGIDSFGVVGNAGYCGVRGQSALDPANDYADLGRLNIGVLARGDVYAGLFQGDVLVQGTLMKSAGSFTIDHPLDPENRWLNHSFVESPDMKNLYDGAAVLDAAGEAWVELPDWFEPLNRDLRYQLTCVGGHAPVYVADEVAGNRFRIAGGRAGLKVCWQVTGTRQDAYAEAHRIQVDVPKAADERGHYLHPAEHGAPPERSLREVWDRRSAAPAQRVRAPAAPVSAPAPARR